MPLSLCLSWSRDLSLPLGLVILLFVITVPFSVSEPVPIPVRLQVTKKLFKDTILQESVDGASGEDNWRIRESMERESDSEQDPHERGSR
jgi:hypothetical protein